MERPQGLAQDPGGIIRVRGADREAAAGERRDELGARESALVESAALSGDLAVASPDPARREPADAVHIRHRDDEHTAGREHTIRFGEDRVGPPRVVLDHAERDISRERTVGDREAAKLHERQRRRRRTPAGSERLEAPVHAGHAPAPLAEEQHVLTQTAARFQDDAVGGQGPRDQIRQRRAPGDRQELLHRMSAPVLDPELLHRCDRIVREHRQPLRASATNPVV